jgi:hypothetical protein
MFHSGIVLTIQSYTVAGFQVVVLDDVPWMNVWVCTCLPWCR